MITEKLMLIPVDLLESYSSTVSEELPNMFERLEDADVSTSTFNFYTSVAAIASSRIEGEQMDVDSYVKHKMLNIKYQADLVQKPDDLYQAYLFAQENELCDTNLLHAHTLLTAHLLPESKRGVFRAGNMVVMEHQTGRIQFEAAPAGQLNILLDLLWQDIESLKKEHLSSSEVFYFASFIHLVFVNIHPFEDGNGRTARLLEKWFISEKLGKKAWHLQSELHYYQNVNAYYKNLNRLGIFYDQLDYTKAMPFLLMLPDSFNIR